MLNVNEASIKDVGKDLWRSTSPRFSYMYKQASAHMDYSTHAYTRENEDTLILFAAQIYQSHLYIFIKSSPEKVVHNFLWVQPIVCM